LGHLLTLVAGLLAVGHGGLAEQRTPDLDPDPEAAPARPGSRQGPVILGLCLGVLTAVGLLAAPFSSTDPYVLARDVLDIAHWSLAGGVLIALAVPVISTMAMAAVEPVAVRGWLFSAAAVVIAVALPNLLSGLLVAGLGPSLGPYLALVGALLLFGMALRARTAVA